jgi:RND superfamily putative drug exporter
MTIAQGGDAKVGLVALKDSGIGTGVVMPHEVLVRGNASPDEVASALSGIDGIHGAVAPGDGWRSDGSAVVLAIPTPDGSAENASDLTAEVRAVAHAQGQSVTLGGQLAQNDDFIDAVYGNFWLMLLLIGIVTFVLLARAFRSLLLPLKAVILNVISIGAAWGVMTLVWQYGHGGEEIWGVDPTGAITAWMPLMVFAFLYGLSMDYEVFILSRMREEYDKTGDTNEAVIQGIGRTGRLVTSAALILFLAFMSLAASPGTDIKILATGLAAGILLDATVIRALLVPAVISMFGRWNWWLPDWAARILRVQPSPGTAVPAPAGAE